MSFLTKDDNVLDKYNKIWNVIKNKLNTKHYTCIACITIDSVMRINKKNYPQVYLEECKYKAKKIQMSRFISTELESDSDSESDSKTESISDTELMAMLKSSSDSDSEQVILLLIIFTHTFLSTLNKSFYC